MMFSTLSDGAVSLARSVLELLPESPFVILEGLSNSEFYEWLQFLNWFIPINTFVTILETWLTCVAVYYIHQIVLRWLKVIE